MICRNAKAKLKLIEIEKKREVEESIKKAEERSEIIDCLEKGICPNCGSPISTLKIPFSGSIFIRITTLWMMGFNHIHYKCNECKFEEIVVNY